MDMTLQEQVYEELKDKIRQHVYPAGTCLPKEVILASELGVSRQTLRAALERLASEKWVERISGKGTFVYSKTEKSTKILVIRRNCKHIANSSFYFFPYMREAAEKLNVKLIFCFSELLLLKPIREIVQQIQRGAYQGILCFESNFNGNEPILQILKEIQIPVLLPHVNRNDHFITGFPAMGMDYATMIKDGLHYLASKGHYSIAHITDKYMRGFTPEDYFRCIEILSLDPNPDLLCICNDGFEGRLTQRKIERLLTRIRPIPTALFCFSDFFALQAYKVLKQKGIRIPQDVAVLSIGGQFSSEFWDPPLSAIEYNDQRIGVTAINLLLDLIKHKRMNMGFIVTPHQIQERASTRKIVLRENSN